MTKRGTARAGGEEGQGGGERFGRIQRSGEGAADLLDVERDELAHILFDLRHALVLQLVLLVLFPPARTHARTQTHTHTQDEQNISVEAVCVWRCARARACDREKGQERGRTEVGERYLDRLEEGSALLDDRPHLNSTIGPIFF
eukprot:941332-Rhodomonas_salina.1